MQGKSHRQGEAKPAGKSLATQEARLRKQPRRGAVSQRLTGQTGRRRCSPPGHPGRVLAPRGWRRTGVAVVQAIPTATLAGGTPEGGADPRMRARPGLESGPSRVRGLGGKAPAPCGARAFLRTDGQLHRPVRPVTRAGPLLADRQTGCAGHKKALAPQGWSPLDTAGGGGANQHEALAENSGSPASSGAGAAAEWR